jgi:hypothetical protein
MRLLAPLLFGILVSWVQLNSQSLISYENLGFISQAELEAEFGSEMKFGVSLYKVLYTTSDLDGMQVTASGLLVAPLEVGRLFPKMICHHGTVDSKQDVPSNQAGGHQLGLVFGGAGYITLMPDFLGLGESPGFHPYVHADSEARASVDMLLAVDGALLNDLGTDYIANDQLFLTGYSQGGHACMATHRLLQEEYSDEYPVTAAAPMSGPYDISGSMLDLTLLSGAPYFYPAYLGWSSLMIREAYGTYDNMDEIFQEPYAAEVDAFYQGDITLSDLNNFMIDSLTADVGAPIAKFLMHDSIVDILETQPDHPFYQALRDNDLYNWAPQCPTRIFYCQNDDQVPYQNSIVALDSMEVLGAPDIGALDVDPAANHVQCVTPAVTLGILFFATYQDIGFWLNTSETGKERSSLKLSPNPVARGGQIHLTSSELKMGPSSLTIWTNQGNQIWQKELMVTDPSISVQLPDTLPPGVYFVEFRNQKDALMARFVIQPGR